MADTATSPSTEGAHKTRPEKPDEAKFKADVAAAEKAHEAAQARFVRPPILHPSPKIDS